MADRRSPSGGGWTPIGAVQTATGYDVAWQLKGTNEFSVWAVDSNGNYVSNVIGAAAGNSLAWSRSRPPSTRTSTATARSV